MLERSFSLHFAFTLYFCIFFTLSIALEHLKQTVSCCSIHFTKYFVGSLLENSGSSLHLMICSQKQHSNIIFRYTGICMPDSLGDRLLFVIVFRFSEVNILRKSRVVSEPCCTGEREVILFNL